MAGVSNNTRPQEEPIAAIPDDPLVVLMKDYKNPEDLIGETGLLKQLAKQLLESAMQAEMTDHLGCEKHVTAGKKTDNSRNGSYKKRIKREFGNLDMAVPVIANRPSTRSSCPRGRAVLPGSMTRSSPCVCPRDYHP